MKYKFIIPVSLFVLPLLASAQFNETGKIFERILYIVSSVITPLVFVLALLFFFWGIVKYIKSEGDGKAEGKAIMTWGVLAIFVMSSVWGLVRFLQGELIPGRNNSSMPVPTIDKSGGSGGGNTNFGEPGIDY